MNKHAKLIAVLTRAARLQSDPVKRQKIVEKIREIKDKKRLADWMAQ